MSLPDVIVGYGQAWRGDWSFFDGRTCRDDMEVIAGWVRDPGSYPGDDEATDRLGFCIKSRGYGPEGHWFEHCNHA